MVMRGRTRFAPLNDPGPGAVFARRRAPSFSGFIRVCHAGYSAGDNHLNLAKPRKRTSVETRRTAAEVWAESRAGVLRATRTYVQEPTGAVRRQHHARQNT